MKLLLLLVTTLLFSSCIDSPNENDTIKLRPSYFPLAVGNYWKFESPATESSHTFMFNETISVVSDTTINKTDYYVIERKVDDASPHILILREDRYNRIICRQDDGSEWIWFDQYASTETSYLFPFSSEPESKYKVHVFNEKDIVTPSGTYPAGMKFYFDVPEAADEEDGYILVENVGPVTVYSAWHYMELIEYFISGV